MEARVEFPPFENSQSRGPVSSEETGPLARGDGDEVDLMRKGG